MGAQAARERREDVNWPAINQMPLEERKVALQKLLVKYKELHTAETDPTRKVILENTVKQLGNKLDATNRMLEEKKKVMDAVATNRTSLNAAEAGAVAVQTKRMMSPTTKYLCHMPSPGTRELDTGRSLGTDEFILNCKPYAEQTAQQNKEFLLVGRFDPFRGY